MAVAAVLAACGGGEGESSASSTSTTGATTTTAESTTTTTEATTTSEGPAVTTDADLKQQLLDVAIGFSQAYGSCLADTVACDVETTLGPYLGQPQGDQVRDAFAEWSADRLRFKGYDDEEYFYRRHELAIQTPPTYGLELCVVNGEQAVYRVEDDGSETLVEKIQDPGAAYQAFLIEERSDGTFVINVTQSGSDPVEGDTCEEYRD